MSTRCTHIISQLPSRTNLLPTGLSLPRDSPKLLANPFLDSRQLDVIALDAVGLVEALRNRMYTAVEVTEAHIVSASIAHQATNCLSYYDSQSALRQARALDAAFERTGRTVGPHGVVVSLKRTYNLRSLKVESRLYW